MIKYVFREDFTPFKNAKDADPQRIGEALAVIAESGGGKLTSRSVVDTAKDPENALHAHFEWDDALAADQHRLQQARILISCLRVEETGSDQEPQRAFLSVSDDGKSYRTVQEIRSSSDLQAKLLASAERDLEAFTIRYRMLKDICVIVETAKKAVKSKRVRNETRVA